MDKKNNKNLEEELVERFNKDVEDTVKTTGIKIAERELEEKFTQLETEKHVKSFSEKIQQNVAKYNFNLYSNVYFIQSLQLSLSFVLLLLLLLFKIVLELLLLWSLLFIGVVYCLSYCLILRYPDRFKKTSSSFTICTVLGVCEGIILCCLAMVTSYRVFLIEVSAIIVALIGACVTSKLRGSKYTSKAGITICISVTLSFFLIFGFAIGDIWGLLSVCTIILCIYETFLILTISNIVKNLENQDPDGFRMGLYANLLIFTWKIKIFFIIAEYAWKKCCKPKENRTLA
jgi:hypothetical protein